MPEFENLDEFINAIPLETRETAKKEQSIQTDPPVSPSVISAADLERSASDCAVDSGCSDGRASRADLNGYDDFGPPAGISRRWGIQATLAC